MIHTKTDFYNKVSKDIKLKYFANVRHAVDGNKDYYKYLYDLECFSNGALTYKVLISRLAKSCKETNFNMHELVSKYVTSFGSYEYKPKK